VAQVEVIRDADERAIAEFDVLVNMGAATLDRWLHTDESREAGQRADGDRESTGHASGRHIVKMLQKKKSELTGADIAHMHKTVAFIKRHMAQRPAGDISQTRWAHSLKNWGHDPTKDD
jgi:hypothetical protein